jgi:hypothetical protein
MDPSQRLQFTSSYNAAASLPANQGPAQNFRPILRALNLLQPDPSIVIVGAMHFQGAGTMDQLSAPATGMAFHFLAPGSTLAA